VSDPSEPRLTEMESRVLGLIGPEDSGITAAEMADALGVSPEEAIDLLVSAASKVHALIGPSISKEVHTHPDHPMDAEELLSHLRFMHARGVPRYELLDPGELPVLHSRLHFEPPSPA
jgi:hypothetical protein